MEKRRKRLGTERRGEERKKNSDETALRQNILCPSLSFSPFPSPLCSLQLGYSRMISDCIVNEKDAKGREREKGRGESLRVCFNPFRRPLYCMRSSYLRSRLARLLPSPFELHFKYKMGLYTERWLNSLHLSPSISLLLKHQPLSFTGLSYILLPPPRLLLLQSLPDELSGVGRAA
jgi:hypothetical protein